MKQAAAYFGHQFQGAIELYIGNDTFNCVCVFLQCIQIWVIDIAFLRPQSHLLEKASLDLI